MSRHRLLWRLYLSHLLVIFVCVVVVGWYAASAQRRFYRRRLAADLTARARFVGGLVRGKLADTHADEINALCRSLGEESSARVTVVDPSGRVLGDSQEDPARMRNQRLRPEVRGALAGEADVWRQTRPKEMMYVAVPVVEGEEITGAVRVSAPLTAIDRAVARLWAWLAVVGLGVAALAVVPAWVAAGHIRRPLEDIRKAADRFADGDFAHELPRPATREAAEATDALNRMADALDDRFRAVVGQCAGTEAILSSMVEGVLAVDTGERVLSINLTAAGLLGVDPARAVGRSLQEVARNSALQELAARARRGEAPVRGEIALHRETDRHVETHVAPLRDNDGRRLGTVFVFHDVTRLRRLERIRRDFVANVSHELRTPVTAIKGFVETLMAEDSRLPAEAQRFLRIVGKQTDRLNAIIDDLLTLSRLEREAPWTEVPLERKRIIGVLKSAIEICRHKAREKNVEIGLRCDEGLTGRVNPALLEQAVVNLVDNAIAYSKPESAVTVEGEKDADEILIRVRDHGVGIPSQHLPRVFERFYRVDKARSRREGGTGLGLAIVKHIMQVHRGRATVRSTLGEGSVFTLHLPLG